MVKKHYRWWLKQELDLVGPRLVVAMGATVALALAGMRRIREIA